MAFSEREHLVIKETKCVKKQRMKGITFQERRGTWKPICAKYLARFQDSLNARKAHVAEVERLQSCSLQCHSVDSIGNQPNRIPDM